MWKTNNRKQNVTRAAAAFMALGLSLLNTGCGRSESSSTAPAKKVAPSSSGAAAAPAPAIPAPVVPEDAPVLQEVYPTLASGALRLARLTDLPDHVLLRAEGVSITESDLGGELAHAPAEAREDMRKNAFFLLEQKATMEILTALARRQIGKAALPQDQLLPRYFEEITRTVSVTDADAAAFYEENRGLVGDAPLAQVKPRILEHLRQQKQQEAVEAHVAALGNEMTIALSAEWVKKQAALTLDNPVDQARASGKPTFVNFGAKGCIPCDKMEPIREEIKREYEGRLNVVFVHVNQDRTLASRYGIRGIPHLAFFDKDGREVHAHSGFMPKEQIEEWVKKSGVSDL